MKRYERLDLIHPPSGALIGNHGIWLPSFDGRSLKVPFQFGGLLTKFTRYEAAHPRASIADEVAILRALADQQMAPPVGDWVYFEEVVSNYPGAYHSDPCGAIGFELADAHTLPPGRFSLEAMRALPIEGTAGAWGDVEKAGNIVNGYLVDVRRSDWDMLRWCGERPELPEVREPVDELRDRVHRECQFPAGERKQAYQDFWLRGRLERGQRRVIERAQALRFAPRRGESVLDIGCQSASFLQYAHHATEGHGRYAGVETSATYLRCAQALCRSFSQNICLRRLDAVRDHGELLRWVKAYFPGERPDHLLLLSMEKHLGDEALFALIDAIGAGRTYLESNAVAEDSGEGPEPAGPMKLWPEVARRGGKHVGNSRDRNLRRLYVIERGT